MTTEIGTTSEIDALRLQLHLTQTKYERAVAEAKKWHEKYEKVLEKNDPDFVWQDEIDAARERIEKLGNKINEIKNASKNVLAWKRGAMARANGMPLDQARGAEKDPSRIRKIDDGWHRMDNAILSAVSRELKKR